MTSKNAANIMIFTMLVIIPLFMFISLNSVCVFVSKRSFGLCIPVTLMLSALILYFSQFLFSSFTPGYVFFILAVCCSVFLIILKRKDAGFPAFFFSNGFWAFVIIGILFFIADYNRHFSSWDEFSHWGKMIKEMLRLDAFYSVPASDLLPHKEYPPLISLFEMLWCRLSGGYSESGATLALHVFEFSMIVPLLADKIDPPKGIIQKIGVGFAVFFPFFMLAAYCDTENVLTTIYTDYALPLVFSYPVAIILDDENAGSSFCVFSVLLSLFCLILVKQIGIAYVLLVLLLLFIRVRKPFVCIAAAVTPAASFLLWNHYTNALGLKGQFDFSRINLGNIFAIIFGTSDNLRVEYTTSKYYFKALFDRPVTAGLVDLPFAGASLLCLLVVVLLFLCMRNSFKTRDFASIVILLVCGTIGYAVLMFVMYMFCFREVEMLGLFSFERYFGSFILGELTILAVLALYLYSGKNNSVINIKTLVVTSIASLLIMNPTRLIGLFPQVLLYGNPSYTYEECANKVQDLTLPGCKLLVCSSNDEMNVFYLGYYLENRSLDTQFMYSNIQDVDDDSEIWDYYIDELKACDFYYVFDVPDNIDAHIGKYTDAGKLEKDSVYKIQTSDGELSLIKTGD